MLKNWLLTLFALLTLTACNKDAMTMNDLPATSPVRALFAKTKPVCFGRFVIDVPEDAQVVWGGTAFGASIATLVNEAPNVLKIIAEKEREILNSGNSNPEITESRQGDTRNTYLLAYWEDKHAKRVGLEEIWTYVVSNANVFIYMSSIGDNEQRSDVLSRSAHVAQRLRARAPDEIPTNPGVCIDHGFIADNSGKYQEIFQIGFRFPSMPDLSFSMSSNKDAQRDEGLLARAREVEKRAHGTEYEAGLRHLKKLRVGKREVGRWQGEELLYVYDDKKEGRHHEFTIESQGVRYDKNLPFWNAQLHTGVVGNRAGEKASGLTDDEAIVVWNTLLNSLRLRVAP